ncbi:MAG: ABC transporter substrate-binding protein [Dehalobacterium sp.]
MKIKIIGLVSAIAMMLLFSGCGQKSVESAQTGVQENKNKELIVGVVKANSNFDPYGSYGDETYGHMQVYDTLVIKDKDGAIAPSLAEKYEVSPDGLTYTFFLRQGVKFSNDTDFTAADAKFSIDKGIESSYTNWVMAGVAGSEIVDDYTVKITLNKADVSFLEKLTWIYLVSEAAYQQFGDQYGKTAEAIIGTGPYVVKEWKAGELVVFEANPNYFLGAPDIKKVSFKTISDANAAVIALQTGEIGLYLKDIPGIAVNSIGTNDKLTLTHYSSYVFMDVLMNCQTGIFTDPRLRKAVAYGVDRGKMLQVGTEGQGTIVDYPGGPDYMGNPNVNNFYQVDVEKAKALVKEAGMEGKTVTIKTMDTDPWPKLATALQDDLGKIGLVAKVEQIEMNAYSQDVWQKANYEIAISRYWSGTKDMSETMSLLETGGSMNFSKYSNPLIDPYLVKASAEMDTEVRKQLYTEAIKIFTEDVPLIPLYYTQGNRAYSKDLVIEEGNVQYDHIYYYRWAQ